MSRIGKKPVVIPKNVKVSFDNNVFKAEGAKGKLERKIDGDIKVIIADGLITLERGSDIKKMRELHGLYQVLISNMIHGVEKGFEKKLEVSGVGYKVNLEGKNLKFALGYSHPIIFEAEEGIQFAVEGTNIIIVRGIDKEQVGQVSANIKKLRLPDKYKGKGVRYSTDKLKLKPGKTGK